MSGVPYHDLLPHHGNRSGEDRLPAICPWRGNLGEFGYRQVGEPIAAVRTNFELIEVWSTNT
jgi:hypothetical protein